MWLRLMLILCALFGFVGCSFGRRDATNVPGATTTSIANTAMATSVPTHTPKATNTAIPQITTTPIPVDTTVRVRVIAADTDTYAPIIEIVERAADAINLDVIVDVRSPDGALALQQGYIPGDVVDVWIASAFDVWQLAQIGALSSAPITSDIPMYQFGEQGKREFANRGVAPIAAQNYFISIYNTEILSSAPATTEQLQAMPGLLVRPRYRMAFPWAEGRWFDEVMSQLTATTVLSDGVQAINPDSASTAIQTMVNLRALGPRDATTYLESTTDFLYSRVPYTIDGDAALRRYAVLSDTLLLDYALPPVLSATNTMWLPDVDVVYAAIPDGVSTERRNQVLLLIRQLQRGETQRELFRQLRWIPVRNDVLPNVQDDKLAVVLETVGQLVNAQIYNDAVICRWDSYEQVLPLALLKIRPISVVLDTLDELITNCPMVPANS